LKNLTLISKKKITILIAPLDWGLGHASRCIPIIKYLSLIDCDVIIASDGIQQSLLQAEFPHLQFINLPGYRVTFSKNRWKTLIKYFWQIPKILISINQENKWLQNFLLKNRVDAIISDNRYGLSNKNISSIFITHQLTIRSPFGIFFENLFQKINYYYINKFNECWVPDFEDSDNMGGKLSHPDEMPLTSVKFLGRLSRIVNQKSFSKSIQLLVILSGPEPQRSIFEEILLAQLQTYGETTVFIRGLPGKTESLINSKDNLSIYNHASATALNEYINEATFIISRSGYSTVMDLMGLMKKCIFVPTPGQSEQEYLAEYLSSRKFCLSYKQSKFHLGKAIREAAMYKFENFKHSDDDQYQKVITDLISNLLLVNKLRQ
jgi:UDP-N-acetylglucosamine transferase subunit ALG13